MGIPSGHPVDRVENGVPAGMRVHCYFGPQDEYLAPILARDHFRAVARGVIAGKVAISYYPERDEDNKEDRNEEN